MSKRGLHVAVSRIEPYCVLSELDGERLCETLSIREERTMFKFTQAIVNFVKREDGPTAVEYAVMLALIIVVCLTAITTLGTNANSTFSSVGTKLGSASS
jgi:pilus assembly protein Flp/PilA